MVVSIEIKKTNPKGHRKCQNIHIHLYIFLSIIIEYSFWKDIKTEIKYIYRQITRFFDE